MYTWYYRLNTLATWAFTVLVGVKKLLPFHLIRIDFFFFPLLCLGILALNFLTGQLDIQDPVVNVTKHTIDMYSFPLCSCFYSIEIFPFEPTLIHALSLFFSFKGKAIDDYRRPREYTTYEVAAIYLNIDVGLIFLTFIFVSQLFSGRLPSNLALECETCIRVHLRFISNQLQCIFDRFFHLDENEGSHFLFPIFFRESTTLPFGIKFF
jgi:hypothetical protein